MPLTEARAAAATELAEPYARAGEELGLAGGAEIAYRPRTAELDADGIVAELADRREGDIARGFTGFGPHRDEVELSFGGRSLGATAPRDSSGSVCWRCCSPSARRCARPAGSCRCSCSTT